MVWNEFGAGELFREQEHKSGGHWTADFLLEELQADRLQLWLVLKERRQMKAALITDIRPYPNGLKTCMVTVVVGQEPRAWIGLQDVLCDWAKRSGCEKMEVIGRLGWKRILTDWQASAMFYEKSLN